MLKTNASLTQLAQEVNDFLSKHIHVERLILFGSYRAGTNREDSDIDIAVISDDFNRISIWDRISLLAKVSVAVDSRLELIAFTPTEYSNPEDGSLLKERKNFDLIEIIKGSSGIIVDIDPTFRSKTILPYGSLQTLGTRGRSF